MRNGGRNLPVSSWNQDERLPKWETDTKCFLRFQASAHLDLGVRAGQKLREMARREEEEEVKTKVKQLTLEAEFTLGPGQVGSNLRNQRALKGNQ